MGIKKVVLGTMTHPKHDHFDTPYYAVEPLLKFINPRKVIWEPTDTTGKSLIAQALREHGCSVISTSKERALDKTQSNLFRSKKFDFLKDTPDFNFDLIVTNPPFSLKDAFIERCIELCRGTKREWALLLPITALEGVARGKMFRKMSVNFRVLVLDRRVEFMGGKVWFNTSWFCKGILPDQLVFAELDKRNKQCEDSLY